MASTKKSTKQENPEEYFKALDHPMKPLVEALRTIVLTTNNEIGEQVKWNSLCFYYTGDMKAFDPNEYKRDIVVFNLYKESSVLLVFPTGAIVEDAYGLLQGSFKDERKTIQFSTLNEVEAKKDDLQTVIRKWLALIDK